MRGYGAGVFIWAILACTALGNGCGGGGTATVLAVVSTSLPSGTVGTPYAPMLEAGRCCSRFQTQPIRRVRCGFGVEKGMRACKRFPRAVMNRAVCPGRS
jgi:hypothetical protein